MDLYVTLKREYPNSAKNIGIIAPYQAQKYALKLAFREKMNSWKEIGGKSMDDIEIATVDGFQVIKILELFNSVIWTK